MHKCKVYKLVCFPTFPSCSALVTWQTLFCPLTPNIGIIFPENLWLKRLRISCRAGAAGSIPEWGRSPGDGRGNPLQYSWLENSMDRGAQWATVHGVVTSQIRLKLLGTHTQECMFYMKCPAEGQAQSICLRYIEFIQNAFKQSLGRTWRRQWHPTPVLLPGKSHGWRSLVGCSPWGR